MDEIGRLIQALGGIPFFLAALLLTYLILKTPAGTILAKKLLNGERPPTNNVNHINGAAGEASVEFWKATHRDIVKAALVDHEHDEIMRYEDLGRRYGDLRDALKELANAQKDAAKESREGLNRVVDAIVNLGSRMPRI